MIDLKSLEVLKTIMKQKQGIIQTIKEISPTLNGIKEKYIFFIALNVSLKKVIEQILRGDEIRINIILKDFEGC